MKRNCMFLLFGVSLLWLVLAPASAATRAWLDRKQLAPGESAILNIETDQATALPDLSPLGADFELSGQSDNRRVSMANGVVTARTNYTVNLTPRRAGVIAIPALRVGAERTAPMALTVSTSPNDTPARGNATAFLETEVDDPNPYVQQSVGVTIRLFYAVPLASGQLDLATPDGASLQQVGKDVQSSRQVNGRNYNVVERRFLMVPER
ncbi:MAG TPA: BatD family protein, partial [Pseudoxanthomonas sp.]|nr:BatD family protein [Pseudoxanthomonas sp.]